MATNLLQQLNQEMSTVVDRVRRSLVQITNGHGGAGAGTIWRADGLILTNAHVVRGRGQPLKVTLWDGRHFPAQVLAEDQAHDLAALKIDATDLPTVEVGEARALLPGEWVLGVGHPWGISGAVTAGAVIDVGRSVEGSLPPADLIQVGLHLRPGHSGGPLVDATGRLVGVNTMINGPDVGLAIPLATVKGFLQQALKAVDEPKPRAEVLPAVQYI
jgi:serine protease Do